MARPRAADPRVNQLILRLTDGQLKTLDAVAFLEGKTPNQYVFEHIVDHLTRLESTDDVRDAIDVRERYQSHAASTTKLGNPKRARRADHEPKRRVAGDAL